MSTRAELIEEAYRAGAELSDTPEKLIAYAEGLGADGEAWALGVKVEFEAISDLIGAEGVGVLPAALFSSFVAGIDYGNRLRAAAESEGA